MKVFVAALALAALVATPAAAKSRHAISPQAAAAQASAPNGQSSSFFDGQAVIVNGRIVGRDPDAAIRADLLRQGDPALQNGI